MMSMHDSSELNLDAHSSLVHLVQEFTLERQAEAEKLEKQLQKSVTSFFPANFRQTINRLKEDIPPYGHHMNEEDAYGDEEDDYSAGSGEQTPPGAEGRYHPRDPEGGDGEHDDHHGHQHGHHHGHHHHGHHHGHHSDRHLDGDIRAGEVLPSDADVIGSALSRHNSTNRHSVRNMSRNPSDAVIVDATGGAGAGAGGASADRIAAALAVVGATSGDTLAVVGSGGGVGLRKSLNHQQAQALQQQLMLQQRSASMTALEQKQLNADLARALAATANAFTVGAAAAAASGESGKHPTNASPHNNNNSNLQSSTGSRRASFHSGGNMGNGPQSRSISRRNSTMAPPLDERAELLASIHNPVSIHSFM
jgi:hypothetical protein